MTQGRPVALEAATSGEEPEGGAATERRPYMT